MNMTREERIAEAKAAVERAKSARAAWERSVGGWEEFREAAREALAKVGAVLESSHVGEGREECERACNAVRAEFGLGAMEEMPWDGVNELVGWDVVIEREG